MALDPNAATAPRRRPQQAELQRAGTPTSGRVVSGVRSKSKFATGELVGDRYRLISLLGRGGMGEVWLAEHEGLKTRVALKVLLQDSPAMFERFRFEAQVSARIGGQTPHLVNVFDAGIEHRGPYMAMEYVPGLPLNLRIEVDGRLPLDYTARILEQIAQAVATAHAHGIVHRDIKPANILITDEGLAKLTDFGVAKGVNKELELDTPKATAMGIVVGTPDYLSPEQVRGDPIDFHSDLWALAVTAYEMVTGTTPFCADNAVLTMAGISHRTFVPASRFAPDLPSAMDRWFSRALDKDPLRRFQSVEEMIQALKSAISDSAPIEEVSPVASVEESVDGSLSARAFAASYPTNAEITPIPRELTTPPPPAAFAASSPVVFFSPPPPAQQESALAVLFGPRARTAVVIAMGVVALSLSSWVVMEGSSAPVAKAPSSPAVAEGVQAESVSAPPADVVAAAMTSEAATPPHAAEPRDESAKALPATEGPRKKARSQGKRRTPAPRPDAAHKAAGAVETVPTPDYRDGSEIH